MIGSIRQSQSKLIWRRAAIAVWLVIALVYLAFYLIDLRLDYVQIQDPCQGDGCNWMAVSTAEMSVLESWGLSSKFFAAFMTGGTVITVVVYWLLGGLLLWREGGTVIGLAVSLTLILMPIVTIADVDNVSVNYPQLLIPAVILQVFGVLVLFLFIYLFPNGRFTPKWAPFFLLATMMITVVAQLDFTGLISFGPTGGEFFSAAYSMIFFIGGGFQVYRYLRVSTPIERLQTKWVLAGLLITMMGIPLWALVYGGLVEYPPGEVRLLVVMLSSFIPLTIALPITVTIAILRYRLWDIDLIIRKTLIYFVLTAMLFGIFFGSVVVLQSLFATLIDESNTAIVTVISTLAVAALFNPLRHRMQNLIDRRFYRQRYDAEIILDSFSSQLRDEVDLIHLQKSIIRVVEKTMRPAAVSLWLRGSQPEQERRESNN